MAKKNDKAAKHLDAKIKMLRRLQVHDFTLTHILIALEVLKHQRSGGKVRLVDIAESLGIPFTTLSRAAWDLVTKHGLIKYEADPRDRRSKFVVVSDARRLEQLVAI